MRRTKLTRTKGINPHGVPKFLTYKDMATLERTENLYGAFNRIASDRLQGLLVFLSSERCPWCQAVAAEQLLPRLRSQSLPTIAIVEFNIQDTRPFRSHQIKQDERGHKNPAFPERLSPAAWAKAIGIRAVPTIVAVDEKLQPIVTPLVGYNLADFYGSYLEDQVNASIHYWRRQRSLK